MKRICSINACSYLLVENTNDDLLFMVKRSWITRVNCKSPNYESEDVFASCAQLCWKKQKFYIHYLKYSLIFIWCNLILPMSMSVWKTKGKGNGYKMQKQIFEYHWLSDIFILSIDGLNMEQLGRKESCQSGTKKIPLYTEAHAGKRVLLYGRE